jgi:ArsR family transcriptional regulator
MMTHPRREIFQLHANLCAALGDANRLLVLYELARQPRRVSDLAAALELPQPAVSRYLKKLREQCLVQSTREGASVFYRLADPRIIDALELLREVLRDRVEARAQLLAK